MNYLKTSQTIGSADLSVPAKKIAYMKPSISIMEVESATHLMQNSFEGDHKSAQPGTGPAATSTGLPGTSSEEFQPSKPSEVGEIPPLVDRD